MSGLNRISKREAQKRFANREPVIFCPCLLWPGGPWNVECEIDPKPWIERADTYRGHPDLWKGDAESTAWCLAYANWAYYNTGPGQGRYAHYYVRNDQCTTGENACANSATIS